MSDVPLHDAPARRIAEDLERGEPPFWSGREVREAEMKLTVEEVGADGVKLRLEGKALMSTEADPARAERARA